MFRDDAMTKFDQWLHEQQKRGDGHFLCTKVELRPVDGDSMGYGLFAREDIRLNETAIKVPERMMITAGMVADIAEYAAIMERVPLDPSEVLALFFCFERVHFDCFCEQTTANGPFLVQWAMDIPPGFDHFMKMRKSRRRSADEFWWRPYLGILPLRFGTPLFRHYLRGGGDVRLRRLADKLPQEAKNKLLGQLAELETLEKKLFSVLYSPYFDQKTNCCSEETFNVASYVDKMPHKSFEFWREMCCWAWHVVNTRCIFVPDLPFHPLVDSPPLRHNGAEMKEPTKRRQRIKRRTENAAGSEQRTEAANGRAAQNGGTTAPEADGYGNAGEKNGEGDYGGSLALIPLVDMLNHSTDAQCVAMFDHQSSRHYYLIRADRHFVPAGHQLFVCYGAHDNARLWVEYGFIMNGWNMFSRVVVPRDLFVALAERCGVRVSEKRREVLKKANLSCSIYATDEKPSFSLRKSCTILLLQRDKLQNWSQYIFGNDFDDDLPNGSDSLDEMQLLGSILGHLQKALEGRKANCFAGGENGENAQNEREAAEKETQMMAQLWEDQIEIVRKMAEYLADSERGDGLAEEGLIEDGTDTDRSIQLIDR